jgi:adenylate cyclase
VNVAARVAAVAKPGEILVSSAACERLSETEFTLKRKRRFRAKGTPKDLDVFAIEQAKTIKI